MAYRIRELREKKKLTQEQLAQMSGVSRTTIVLLENNEEHEAMVGTLKSLECPCQQTFYPKSLVEQTRKG